MDAYDYPPSYYGSSSSSHPSPTYSPTAGHSELVLQTQSLGNSAYSSSHEYIFSTKSLELNLGPRLWGTNNPAYGSGAVVEGRVCLSGDLKNVSSIVVKLEGKVSTTFTERGLVSGAATTDILAVSATLSPSRSGDWSPEHLFSLPFPSYALGSQSRLPPSTITYQPGVTCEIKYWLKVTMVRKGFRRNDSLKIPILHLPRTFSKAHLPHSIPNVIGDSGTILPADNRIRLVHMKASYATDTKCPPPAVVLALPSTLSFASYDAIPLTLSIVSPKAPALTKLLLSAVRIQLIRRTRLWVNSGRMGSKHDLLLGIADIVKTDESRVGVGVMVCELRSARPTTQLSWHVAGVAEQQHFIRVIVRPPSSTADHVPSFEYEQPIEMTTDAFDSPEHEVLALGGAPSPAIGFLARTPSPNGLVRMDTSVSSARNAYMGIVR